MWKFVLLSCFTGLVGAAPAKANLSQVYSEFINPCGEHDEFMMCLHHKNSHYIDDIRLTDADFIAYQKALNCKLASNCTLPRGGVLDMSSRRWPDNHLVYYIDPQFGAQHQDLIHSAVREITSKTCFTASVRTTETDYIHVTPQATGCWSYIGRIGGVQQLNLQPWGCLNQIGITIHEFLHAIGYHHMQMSANRDEFVEIMFGNIYSDKESNFLIHPNSYIPPIGIYGFAYDYGSVMHYNAYAFSQNSLPTIIVKKPGFTIGQRAGLSLDDVATINLHFCSGQATVPTTTTTTTTTQRPTTSSSTTQSPTQPPSGGCPIPVCVVNGSTHPHSDKFKYYMCSYSTPFVMNCPSNLVYDVSQGLCNYFGQAACAS